MIRIPSPSYILDSGATLHISNTRVHFADLFCLWIYYWNFVQRSWFHQVFHPATSKILTVTDVCCVPKATQNLIPIKKASPSGTFTFSHEAVHNMSSSDDEASKIATACGLALYEFDYVLVIGDVLTVPGVHFHAALGQTSPAIMRRLEFPSGPTLVECSCCASGKVTRVLPKQLSSPRSKAPLPLIHADVSGPVSIPGFGAEKYFLAIVDDFFRWFPSDPYEYEVSTNAYVQNFILTAENHISSCGLKVSQFVLIKALSSLTRQLTNFILTKESLIS